MQDFLGGGGGISSVPWFLGSSCQILLDSLYRSEIWSLRCEMEITLDHDSAFAALPAKVSALSFPGFPVWPFIQWISAVRPWSTPRATRDRIVLASFWPGPAPVWLARAIALVESECIIRCPNWVCWWYQVAAASTAATSASKAVWRVPRVLAPWATAGPS